VSLGNALVDVISHEHDEFLDAHGLVKGSMALIDEDRAEELYGAMGQGTEMSGGSAANTAAGLASLGSRCGFVGKVRDDTLGQVFRHDMAACGVAFDSLPAGSGPSTGRCLIVVTSDAERTMSTYLGAGSDMGPDYIDPAVVGNAKVVYLEGYLWDRPEAKEAYRKSSRIAHESGGRVALTLSDSFCVERHRAEWEELVDDAVDILFGNADEIQMLYGLAFDDAVKKLRSSVQIGAITRGAQGSLIVTPDAVHEVPASPVDHLVDTTGAGDLFAAGFLHALTHGAELPECGRIGAIAAAEVITHTGARPLVPLAELI
jgi:sugar/nucleoside kinase (ribokinase family)